MDISIAEAYIAKAQTYGSKLCIVGVTIPPQLESAARNSGMQLKLVSKTEPHTHSHSWLRPVILWADVMISVGSDTMSLTSDEVCCVLSDQAMDSMIPHEYYVDGVWEKVEHARPANQFEICALWDDFKICWPDLYNQHGHKIALIDAGANGDTFFSHYTMQTLIDTVMPYKLQGIEKFVFCNIQETLQLNSLLRAQLFAEIMRDEIGIDNVVYATSAMHAQPAWERYCNVNQIQHPINVISSNWYDLPWRQPYMPMTEYDVPEYDPKFVPEKLFVSFNNTRRWHRSQLGVMLEHNDLLKEGYYSLRQDNANDITSLNMDPKYNDAIDSLSKRVPINLDRVNQRQTHIAFTEKSDIQLHQNSHVSLVTETIYQSDGLPLRDGGTEYVKGCVFYTEKTYKPFWFYQPFIVCAVPGFLKSMRELGWCTFAPYINESYDSETDDNKRMEMIVAELKRLSNFDHGEWLEFRQGVYDSVMANAGRIRREHPGILPSSTYLPIFE